MFIKRILRIKWIIPIKCYSRPISIKEFIFDLKHRRTISDMSSLRSKSSIDNLIVHAFKTLDLIINHMI